MHQSFWRQILGGVLNGSSIQNQKVRMIVRVHLDTVDDGLQAVQYFTRRQEELHERRSSCSPKPCFSGWQDYTGVRRDIRMQVFHEIGKSLVLGEISAAPESGLADIFADSEQIFDNLRR